jgi:phospholipid/cholesterol/gamma-HCH transport system permease protein
VPALETSATPPAIGRENSRPAAAVAAAPAAAAPVAAVVKQGDGRVTVNLSGDWLLKTGFPNPSDVLKKIRLAADAGTGTAGSANTTAAAAVNTATAATNAVNTAAARRPPFSVAFDCAALGHYDSCLPAFLFALQNHAAPELVFDAASLPAAVARLLALAQARPAADAAAEISPIGHIGPIGLISPIVPIVPPDPTGARTAAAPFPPPPNPRRHASESLFFRVGAWGLLGVRSWNKALDSIGQTAVAFARLARGRARCRFRECWFFVQACGVDALPIVGLISFLTGLILAYVGALQMRQVGAMIYVPGGVALSMMREMGVLMASVVLCGRTATAYAAQLGSMQVSEEMSAYRSMGVNPVEYLVLPRMVALVAMLPFLTLYANLFGIAGGVLVSVSMGVTLEQCYNMTALTMTLPNFTSGLIKAFAFAFLIGWAGCFRGMVCGKSSQAVGDAATSAAVLGITLVIIADAVFAVLFNVIDFF